MEREQLAESMSTYVELVAKGEMLVEAATLALADHVLSLRENTTKKFWDAYWWLHGHPSFQCRYVIKGREPREGDDLDGLMAEMGVDVTKDSVVVDSHFEQCLVMGLANEDNGIQVWLECGPWWNAEDLSKMDLEHHPHGLPSIDYDLNVYASTYEEAVIELARLVKEKYGDYERQNDVG